MKYKCFCHREGYYELTKDEIVKMLYSVNRFSPEDFIIYYHIEEEDFHHLMYGYGLMRMISKAKYQNVKEENFFGMYLSEKTIRSFNLPEAPKPKPETKLKFPKFLIKPRMPKEIRRERRKMSTGIIKEVRDIYNNKCSVCGTDKNLHIHHITSISDGGESLPYNLELLCIDHHAEAHKGERAYNLLKSMAERLKE